ncbi:hypothetical protein HMI55_000399 [Coelomomyces lativittatus]|nr:hypothetical protein HMI55_000399 [Coelomomyces lativittatus]
MLNLILGVGISSAWKVIRTGTSVKLDLGPSIHLTEVGLLVVLLLLLIIVPAKNYHFNQPLGIFLILLYFIIMTYALLL